MITNNTVSGFSNNILNRTQEEREERKQELASGLRINNAADDAAGLQISNRLTSQVNAAIQQTANVQDQVNLNTVTEGQLGAVNDALLRAQELSVQSGSPTADPSAIQQEFDQLTEQINTVAESALGSSGFISGLDASDPAATQAALQSALESVGQSRSQLGAENNGLEAQAATYQVTNETVSASRSRIQDTDYGESSSEKASLDVLQQATISLKRSEDERRGLIVNSFI